MTARAGGGRGAGDGRGTVLLIHSLRCIFRIHEVLLIVVRSKYISKKIFISDQIVRQ